MTELQKRMFALKAKYPDKKFASFKRTVSGGKQAIYYGTLRKSGGVIYELVPASFKGDKRAVRNIESDVVSRLEKDTGDHYVPIDVDPTKCPKCGETECVIDVSMFYENAEDDDPQIEQINSLKKENLLVCYSCGLFLVDATRKEVSPE